MASLFFCFGHGQPFCTLPGIQGSEEKKVNYELATPLTDTLKEKKTRRWPMKNFRFICGSSVSQYAKCSNI